MTDLAGVLDEFSPFDERLTDPDHRQAVYAYARERCPVHRSQALDGYWVVSGYDEVVTALQDPTTFSSAQGVRIPHNPARPLMPPIDADGAVHRQWRRVLNPFLSPSTLAPHRATLRSIADELIDAFADRGACDLMPEFAEPYTAWVAGRLLLGVDDRDRLVQIQASNHGIAQAHDRSESEANWLRLRGFVEELVDDRLRSPRPDDLISSLIGAEIDGRRVDRSEAVRCVMILILGGLDTVSDAIGSAVVRVGRDTTLGDRVGDPRWMRGHLDEFLRVDSPVDHEGRTVTRDVELGGHLLRTGDRVMLLYGSANRDGRAFPDPDVLDLSRPVNRHVAFGLGPHRCVGSHLARLEIEVAFEALFTRLQNVRVAPGSVVTWKTGASFGPRTVPLEFDA